MFSINTYSLISQDKSNRISIVLPDLRGGGAVRVAVNLANSFVRREQSVDMVLLSAMGEFLPELDPRVRFVDLNVERMRVALFPVTRYLRHTRLAAFLACMRTLTVFVVWARAVSRAPTRLILAQHTTCSRSEQMEGHTIWWQVRISMRRFFLRADCVVAVARGAADDLARFGQKYVLWRCR